MCTNMVLALVMDGGAVCLKVEALDKGGVAERGLTFEGAFSLVDCSLRVGMRLDFGLEPGWKCAGVEWAYLVAK